ncbi:MAG TPA: ATP-binding protein [bacterium]|nr:ATP-binding protein [bacterium]
MAPSEYHGRLLALLEDVCAALGRLIRSATGDDPAETLTAAVREAKTIAGADLILLRPPEGLLTAHEIRIPQGAPWPPTGLVDRWQARVTRTLRPVRLALRERPRRPLIKGGIVLPVFATGGGVGAVGIFLSRRAVFSAVECASVAALMQGAMARAEAIRIRQHTEAVAVTDVHDRVAREIHDGPLQMLSGIMLHLRLVRAAADERSREALDGLEIEMEQTIRQTRTLIRNLRLAHPEIALEERVRNALMRLEQSRGMGWSLRWEGSEGVLPGPTADEVFQVINEALANVYRHSAAKHVNIRGRVRNGAFEVTVRDDGVGFDVARALRQDLRKLSFGLISMQERMTGLGGTLTLRSQPGRGTRVLINLPLGAVELRKKN